MQPPAIVTEAPPSRVRAFLIGLVALVAAFMGGQWIIELLGWPNNFLVMLGVFIVLDIVIMALLHRVLGR
jgi:hypothetical protein